MFENRDLIDIHGRVHGNLVSLLEQCRDLEPGEFVREQPGFGYPSVHLQLHHVIGAERYWICVLQGRIDADEDAPDSPDVPAMESFRTEISAATRRYLESATVEELNIAREAATWGGRTQTLVPAHVLLRTQMHAYHHMGQVAAMRRLMGKPVGGVDYPHGPSPL